MPIVMIVVFISVIILIVAINKVLRDEQEGKKLLQLLDQDNADQKK